MDKCAGELIGECVDGCVSECMDECVDECVEECVSECIGECVLRTCPRATRLRQLLSRAEGKAREAKAGRKGCANLEKLLKQKVYREMNVGSPAATSVSPAMFK